MDFPTAAPARFTPSPALADLARSVVEDHAAAPAAVVAAAVLEDGSWRMGVEAYGSLFPGGPAAARDTIFDLASVTKPVTALLAARLVRRGALSFGTPLGELLVEARGTPSEDVPLELFLAHRAGLDGHRPLYAPLLAGQPVDRAAALATAAAARREGCEGAPPLVGFSPVYSDLGYLLVGEALARLVGDSLEECFRDELTLPLGLGLRPASWLGADVERTAPTEHADFRGGIVRAAVHDENAWALGALGTCGHAGLFGSATDALGLGVAILECRADARPDVLRPLDLEPLIRRRAGGTLRAGFDGKSAKGSSAGDRFGRETFGHLGFTGTSLWMDPEASVVGVLLTNRVHPTRAHDAIKRARPAVYDGIFGWATSSA